ncbi:SirB2 family protein [Psychrobacter arenosus]|uniref:SirB2 family protein n=1 Tax=Psychrobacter arenosus TaxID=256326 RepID=UPI001919CEB9|nr:SirB2 family protein [Psychrobacter arenosus]
MKHLHMLMAVIVIVLFIYQSFVALTTRQPPAKIVKISTHITYALVILSGAWMLMQLMSVNAPIQWVVAKIVLLIAAISASIKAFKATATPSQTKAGILIAAVAYAGIVALAVSKPGNFF